MIAITRLHNAYRIAGSGDTRAQLVRRLDHVCSALLAQALEGPARDFADPDGPVTKVRRLKLQLWLDMARRSDTQIAEDWARLLARALHRQLAEGTPDNVMHYPSQAAFLAAWAAAVLDGLAQDRWMFAEFAVLHDLPKGRAISAGLARHPDHIAATFRALAGQGQRDRLISALGSRDIAALWTAWTGAAPRRPDGLPLPLLQALPTERITAPAFEPGDASARARTALRWLLALVAPPAGLVPQAAAPLAMQLSQITALFHASPHLRALWSRPMPPADDIRAALADLPADLAGAATWAATLMARSQTAPARALVARLVPVSATERITPATATKADPRSETRIFTPYAGAALLLPALRHRDPETAFTADYRHHLLTGVFSGAQRLLALGDLGLRQFSGLPPDHVLDPPPQDLDDDLTAILDRFRRDLRGMHGATLPYLAKQFFARPGVIVLRPGALVVKVHAIPLKVLLQLAGRLGDQGVLPWLDDLPLRIEVGDG